MAPADGPGFMDLTPLLDRLDARGDDPTWITRLSREEVLARADAATKASDPAPLRGLTFAIKDNIDLAGVLTTAACREYAYTPSASAAVVQRLVDAGAIPLGKTNLDQFATGLVGVRSPYGVPKNPFHADYIPGGSSSGSAVAVAVGLCDFSLGTDTAGSGRVPAAFNNLVGLKPTKGLLSTRGVVPACRSLDCVSIFTRTVADAERILAVAAVYDPEDPFSRRWPPVAESVGFSRIPGGETLTRSATTEEGWPPRVGVPRAGQLEFFGDDGASKLFAAAVDHWRTLGATLVEVDFSPFLEAARLLYEGPWVAERYTAIRAFIEATPEALHPVTRKIIEGGRSLTAVSAFEAMYKLAAWRRRAEKVWSEIDVLLTPTAGTIYTVAQVEADPVRLNSNLGYYTDYMNLLDLCAIAVPAGFLPNGLPWGIMLVAPAFCDGRVLRVGARFLGEPVLVRSHGSFSRSGDTPAAGKSDGDRSVAAPEGTAQLAVCGAHLTGLPLNGQLTSLGATLVRATRTAPVYKLYALPNTTPPKPGLVRVESDPIVAGLCEAGAGSSISPLGMDHGASIDVEVWEMPVAAFGWFVAQIPAPLGVGSITLEDGSAVHGFLCEAIAVRGARDVSAFGGWRAFVSQSRARPSGADSDPS